MDATPESCHQGRTEPATERANPPDQARFRARQPTRIESSSQTHDETFTRSNQPRPGRPRSPSSRPAPPAPGTASRACALAISARVISSTTSAPSRRVSLRTVDSSGTRSVIAIRQNRRRWIESDTSGTSVSIPPPVALLDHHQPHVRLHRDRTAAPRRGPRLGQQPPTARPIGASNAGSLSSSSSAARSSGSACTSTGSSLVPQRLSTRRGIVNTRTLQIDHKPAHLQVNHRSPDRTERPRSNRPGCEPDRQSTQRRPRVPDPDATTPAGAAQAARPNTAAASNADPPRTSSPALTSPSSPGTRSRPSRPLRPRARPPLGRPDGPPRDRPLPPRPLPKLIGPDLNASAKRSNTTTPTGAGTHSPPSPADRHPRTTGTTRRRDRPTPRPAPHQPPASRLRATGPPHPLHPPDRRQPARSRRRLDRRQPHPWWPPHRRLTRAVYPGASSLRVTWCPSASSCRIRRLVMRSGFWRV